MGMERRGRRILDGPEVNWKRDELKEQMELCYASQEEKAAWNTNSRMMGDYQVRFCERPGVKLPRPTRLNLSIRPVMVPARYLARNHASLGLQVKR
jgi:hypothetical protein